MKWWGWLAVAVGGYLVWANRVAILNLVPGGTSAVAPAPDPKAALTRIFPPQKPFAYLPTTMIAAGAQGVAPAFYTNGSGIK